MAAHDKPSKVEKDLLAMKLGAQQALAGGKTLTFGGKVYDAASFLQAVDGQLAPYSNVHQLRTQLENGVDDRRLSEPQAELFVLLAKHAAAAAFGESSAEFALLGFSPRKTPITLTPEQKQHKLEQMRATRAARHTMGKRQKRAVKGDVSSNGGNPGSPATPPSGHTP